MNKDHGFAYRLAVAVAVLTLAFAFATGIASAYYRFKNGRSIYYDFKVARFEKMNADEKENGILFLGDSITDFCDLDRYYPGLDAVNRGIAGDLTVGVLRRMDVSVFDLRPRLVVLLIGVNDLSRGYATETVVGNIIKIVNEIKTRLPDAGVIVQSLYPVNSDRGAEYARRLSPLICTVNTELKARAADAGYVYANIYPFLDDGNGSLIREYSDDGLHPNDAGYKAVSGALAPYIEKISSDRTL